MALAAAAVILASTALTVLGARQIAREHRQADRSQFIRSGQRLADLIECQFTRYEAGLHGLREALLSAGPISKETFHRYVASRDLAKEFPVATGISFVRKVPSDKLTDYEQELQREHGEPIKLRQFVPTPGDRFVVEFREPQTQHVRMVGFDLGSEPTRRQAALLAMETGMATLSAPIPLLGLEQEPQGVLFMLAVYDPKMPTQSTAERRAALIGWVVMPLRAAQLFFPPGGGAESGLDFALFDGQAAHPGALIYDSDGCSFDQQAWQQGDEDQPPLYQEIKLRLGGRDFLLATHAKPTFFTHDRLESWVIWLFGGAITGLSSVLFIVLIRTRASALLLAAEITADLKEKEQQLALSMQTAGLRLWTWEFATDSVILQDFASGIKTMQGSEQPFDGQHWRSLLHPAD